MKIAFCTDAWRPQVNGVVTTSLNCTAGLAETDEVKVFNHTQFRRTVPLPSYPEIRLAVWPFGRLRELLDTYGPDVIFIVTEGPIGWAARYYAMRRGVPFVTAYTTKIPEYMYLRWRVPLSLSYAWFRWFHGRADQALVSNDSMEKEMREDIGLTRVGRWTRGVNAERFRPMDKSGLNFPRPIFTYLGRVAVEKNLEAFLRLDLPGSKVIIGDGPARKELERKYPDAHFRGYRFDEDLVRELNAADVFCFPSKTDTFGLVMLEALACGVPVAAFPVTGPRDIITPEAGCLDEDLRKACLGALDKDPAACRALALKYPWRHSVEQLRGSLARAVASPRAVLRSNREAVRAREPD